MSQIKLEAIADALTSIEGLKVFHYWRYEKDAPYCIWEEDGGIGFDTDNHKGENGYTGSVNLFTHTEFDPYVDSIEAALNEVENLYWRYDGADYEDETNLIHHRWVWRLL